MQVHIQANAVHPTHKGQLPAGCVSKRCSNRFGTGKSEFFKASRRQQDVPWSHPHVQIEDVPRMHRPLQTGRQRKALEQHPAQRGWRSEGESQGAELGAQEQVSEERRSHDQRRQEAANLDAVQPVSIEIDKRPASTEKQDMEPISVVVQQPALPHYRVPIFRALSARAELSVRVLYGRVPGLPNAPPVGFLAEQRPVRTLTIGGQALASWHPSMFAAASSRAEVLVLDDSPRALSAVPALLWARAQGKGVVLWGHGITLAGDAVRLLAFRRWRRHLHDASLFYDADAAERFVALGWPRESVFVAANTLDDAPIRAAISGWSETALSTFRKHNDLQGRHVLLFVSRLTPGRRLEDLLDVLPKLGPEVVLAVVGDGPLRAKYEAHAQRLGIAGRCRFVGALYDEEQLAPWFLSSALACFPGGVGLNIVHAFTYGLPVVASPEGSHREFTYLHHDYNGLALSRCRGPELLSALQRLLQEPSGLARLSRGARATAQTLTVERMVTGMTDAIVFAARQSSQRRARG